MRAQKNNLIAIDDVRKLLIKEFGLKKLSRPSIYNWMKTRGLPLPIAFGVPRKWRRKSIDEWLHKQIED